jgi:hypothetical protein
LFGLDQIPTTAQIRNILDQIAVKQLSGVFEWVYQALRRGGHLKRYHCLGGHLLVTLDGTQYFSSQKIHCEQCSTRTHTNGTTTYFHSAILPVIVAPSLPEVIALAPEFITPQDGTDKQDCEVAAAKRWVNTHAAQLSGQPLTLLGDDLYSHQPMVEQCGAASMNFIFTALPDSHKALYEWLDDLEGIGDIQTVEVRQWNKRSQEIYRYRYVNQVPLRQSQPTVRVN